MKASLMLHIPCLSYPICQIGKHGQMLNRGIPMERSKV
jgi:hypothetical protein